MNSVVDGIGVEEELRAPCNMIAIFATTNVGPEFAIDELDPAVAERFIILRKDTEPAQLVQILKDKARAKGFSPMVALKLSEFFNKTHRMVKTGSLNRHATTRTLARAIDLAKTECRVKEILRDQILLWVDRDSSGYPVADQVAMLSKTIDELFITIERDHEARQALSMARARAALLGTLSSLASIKSSEHLARPPWDAKVVDKAGSISDGCPLPPLFVLPMVDHKVRTLIDEQTFLYELDLLAKIADATASQDCDAHPF